ncbi:MAG: UDP-glucose 4-epimerase GalE [Candidatus Woesearchaeota archaeon]
MKNRKIFVVGGAGYIGSHIVKKLCDENNDVTVYDNLSTGFKINIDKRAKFVKGDILDYKKLVLSMKNFDAIIHFAALKNAGTSMEDLKNYSQVNISGTINVLNAMVENKITYIVFSSSCSVYGSVENGYVDETHKLNPESFYGFTKLEAERLLGWYSKIKGIKYAALRYFNAAGYGKDSKELERDPKTVLPIIMEVLTGRRKELKVFGNDYPTKDGTGVRDYIHVLDLADAHTIALDYIINKNTNLIVNLASGKGYGVIEILQATERLTKRKVNHRIVKRRPGDPSIVITKPFLAEKLLKWKTKYSDLDNIILTMLDAYTRIPVHTKINTQNNKSKKIK